MNPSPAARPIGSPLRKWAFEISLTALLLLTLAVLLIPRQWFERTLVISPQEYFNVYTNSDNSAGGESIGKITNHHGYNWYCDLVRTEVHPYCGFEILLGAGHTQGIKLTDFHSMKLWLTYDGPTEMLRLNLRNYNANYPIKDVYARTKFNQIEFDARLIKDGLIQFDLSNLAVAEWWLIRNKIPPHQSQVEFNNVVVAEISSGADAREGRHTYELKRIEFYGTYLSTETLYLGIISFWLLLIFGFVLVRSFNLSQRLRAQLVRENELIEINQVLDARGQQLDLKSKTDHLTGVFNRQGLEEALQAALLEHRENSQPLSLIMFDLDHFKSINDEHGHLIGDAVLAQVAQLVHQHVRRQDVFARWGGEEFVLVCRDTNANQAGVLAEKIREIIASTPTSNNLQVTASFGVADLHSNQTLDTLFRSADDALYRAKHTGRNRVVIA